MSTTTEHLFDNLPDGRQPLLDATTVSLESGESGSADSTSGSHVASRRGRRSVRFVMPEAAAVAASEHRSPPPARASMPALLNRYYRRASRPSEPVSAQPVASPLLPNLRPGASMLCPLAVAEDSVAVGSEAMIAAGSSSVARRL